MKAEDCTMGKVVCIADTFRVQRYKIASSVIYQPDGTEMIIVESAPYGGLIKARVENLLTEEEAVKEELLRKAKQVQIEKEFALVREQVSAKIDAAVALIAEAHEIAKTNEKDLFDYKFDAETDRLLTSMQKAGWSYSTTVC
jgi:hypothetical protein